MAKVTADFIFGQIDHWLATPVNSYLGSNYGIDLKQYLNKPMAAFDGDAIIAKMRQDIPVLQAVEARSLHIYYKKQGTDKVSFYVELLGSAKEYLISL